MRILHTLVSSYLVTIVNMSHSKLGETLNCSAQMCIWAKPRYGFCRIYRIVKSVTGDRDCIVLNSLVRHQQKFILQQFSPYIIVTIY